MITDSYKMNGDPYGSHVNLLNQTLTEKVRRNWPVDSIAKFFTAAAPNLTLTKTEAANKMAIIQLSQRYFLPIYHICSHTLCSSVFKLNREENLCLAEK